MTSLLERLPESSLWLMILVKMTALLAAAWMAHWLLPGRNPRWRVILWRGVMTGLVVLPVLELAMPAVPVKVPSPAPQARTVSAGPGMLTSDWFGRRPAGYAWRGGAGMFAPKSEPSLLERVQEHTGGLLAIGWGLVAAILAARTLVVVGRVRRLLKGASPAPVRVTTLLERIARDMACSRHVGLRLTAALVSPFLTRVVRPVILLPERMTVPERCGELEGVLAHELAHVRGNDLVWLLLARALSCVLWFHPLAWKIAAAHGQACEEVCDAVAARYVGGAPAYSGMLARVALELMADAPADGGVGMVRAANILQRVRRVKRGIEAAAPARRWIVAALAGGALTLLALGSLKVVYAEQDKQSQAVMTRPVANAATQTQPTREKTLMTSHATVKREGDKVWIEGVKGWSIPEMPSSIHGAQTAIMQALGEKVTYEELVAASGLAFRMQVSKEGMCPSSPHSYCGWQCVSNSNRMLPWKVRVLEAKADNAEAVAEARKAIMASIDRGIPVQYGSEEDGVIVGYQNGGEEWLCLHPYHGKDGKEVFVNKKWPWGMAIFTERKASVPSRRDVASEALRQAVGMARTEAVDVYQMGFAAWEGWIEKLAALDGADEKTRKDSMQGNSWIYFNLVKGRQAAATYLRSIAPEFSDEAAGHLRKAADLYERMASEVLTSKDRKPQDVAPGWRDMKPGQTWQAETRAEQVRRLKAALPLEREAIGEIAKALEIEKIDVTNVAPPASGKTEGAAPQAAEGPAPASSARLDFSGVVLRGNPCTEDSFSKVVQTAAKLLGRDVDLQTIQALSTNAFAPNVRLCEPCKSWWDVQAQDRAIDLVARRIGLQVRPLPALDHSADPPMPTDPEADRAWLLTYHRKPIVPAIRKALDSGQVVIAGNEWDFRFHSNAWFGWGIITDAREDGTILGACLNGRRDNPMNYVDNAWVLSAGEPTMSTHQADLEMLRLAVDRIRGNMQRTRTDSGGGKDEYVFGLEAMDAWIQVMQTVPGFCAECQARGGGWSDALDGAKLLHGGAVLATSCLRSLQDTFPTEARPHLEAAARQYDRIAQLLRPAITTGDPGHYKTFVGDLAKQKVHADEILRPIRGALASAGDEMAKALAIEGIAVKPATARATSPASQPAASASSTKESSVNTVRLDGLKQPKMWMTRPGCLISCAQYLKSNASPAWIYGGTGYAFAINIHKDICPSGPTAWPSEECDARAANVGLVVKAFGADKRRPDFQAERKKVWQQTQAAIDAGQPCLGWEMDVPDWYVINGYDAEGNYLFDDFGRAEGRKPWSTLGDSEIGVVAVQTVAAGRPADDRTVVREAIRFAIEHSRGKGSRADWHAGLAGYDTWISALTDEEALAKNKTIAFGTGYNAACWKETRNHAAAFLKEAKQRLDDRGLDPLFDEAIESYSTVAADLASVAMLYPAHDKAGQAQVMDSERRGKAVVHLQSAKQTEAKGLAALARIAEALDGTRAAERI